MTTPIIAKKLKTLGLSILNLYLIRSIYISIPKLKKQENTNVGTGYNYTIIVVLVLFTTTLSLPNTLIRW